MRIRTPPNCTEAVQSCRIYALIVLELTLLLLWWCVVGVCCLVDTHRLYKKEGQAFGRLED